MFDLSLSAITIMIIPAEIAEQTFYWLIWIFQGAVMSSEIGWNLNSEQCWDIWDWRQMMRRFSSNSYLWQKQTSQTFK